MKINSGVEWAAHACTLLAFLPAGWALSAEALASFHGVPKAYMAKQLQALSKAGLVQTTRGPAGGYRLAKPASEINLWDIMRAVDGPDPAFRCTEIRQQGSCPVPPELCARPCGIASVFGQAEQAFRSVLKDISVAQLNVKVAQESTPDRAQQVQRWIASAASKIV